MTVRVSEAARDEINGIARWYDTQPSQYGAAFLEEVEAALVAVEANPRLHPPAEEWFRLFTPPAGRNFGTAGSPTAINPTRFPSCLPFLSSPAAGSSAIAGSASGPPPSRR